MTTLEDNRLVLGSVQSMVELGEGTRVCLDFIDALAADEGVLVGNTGHGYALLLSEGMATATYPPRPFRVNAGAIHQYLRLADDKVCYLSDIKAGMLVPVFRSDGRSRLVALGRVKVEKRPMLRVCLDIAGVPVSVTIQQSDSIRFAAQEDSISMPKLKVNDAVFCYLDQPGRHIGERIEEYISEY
ncbi:MAG: 3-dehydroquinate synthase II [Mariprofundus sp.]|nr:3-dehydroquinate synthase II [Mariprofundus sp.]